MQLWINTVNLKVLENIEDLLFADDKTLAMWFLNNLPWEVYENLSPQYEFQVVSGMQIRKLLWWWAFKNIKWIYFWSDQCEFLLPTVEEIKAAVTLLKEFDKKYVSNELKKFVFVTPYYWNPKIRERLIQDLQYLNENAWNINPKTKTVEVIINDYWTLKLLNDYPNLVPVMWRLLIKTLKNPIVDTLWLEKNVHIPWELMKNKSVEEINKTKEYIASNQMKWLSSSVLNNEYYQSFLSKYNVNRAGLDYLQERSDLYKTWVDIDIYYPYALVFVWRLCDTSAVDNIRRWYYPIDDLCPRTCLKYDLFIKNFETVWYKLIQRWNAQFKSQLDLDFLKEVLDKYENRLVYTPLI